MDTPILIAFGANIDPLDNLRAGLSALHRQLGIRAISTVYRTTALHRPQDPDFLNGSALLLASPAPRVLRALLKEIEQAQNRLPGRDPNAPRTLDLDIALMGSWIMEDGPLRIPDPDIPARPFLALPLAELAGEFMHPRENVTLRTLAERLTVDPHTMRPDRKATRILQAIPTEGR